MTPAEPLAEGEMIDSYAAFQQRRGRLPDLIEEAISIHAGFMLDDDFDAYGCLEKIVAKLKTARDFYDTAAVSAYNPNDRLREALEPNVRRRLESVAMTLETCGKHGLPMDFAMLASDIRAALSHKD